MLIVTPKNAEHEKKLMEAETVVLRDETRDNRSLSSWVTRFTASWQLLSATQLIGESQNVGEIVTSFL
jgi:phage terminase large subunit-like protein